MLQFIKETNNRLITFLRERLAEREYPRSIGEALVGMELGGFWKYRVGDYRIIAYIQDKTLSILVIRIGYRRAIYN